MTEQNLSLAPSAPSKYPWTRSNVYKLIKKLLGKTLDLSDCLSGTAPACSCSSLLSKGSSKRTLCIPSYRSLRKHASSWVDTLHIWKIEACKYIPKIHSQDTAHSYVGTSLTHFTKERLIFRALLQLCSTLYLLRVGDGYQAGYRVDDQLALVRSFLCSCVGMLDVTDLLPVPISATVRSKRKSTLW